MEKGKLINAMKCYLVLYSLMLAVTQCSELGLGISDRSKHIRQEVCSVFDPYALSFVLT